MRMINPKKFEEAKKRFPEKARSIDSVQTKLKGLSPKNSSDLKQVMPSLEKFPGQSNCYRLDVGGRKGLRMIAVIQITNQSVYVHLLGSHDEYYKFKF